MKQGLTAAALLVLVVVVSFPAEAAECSLMRAPSWEEAIIGSDTPDGSAAPIALQEEQNCAVDPQANMSDGAASIKTTTSLDHCPNWACWQEPWGCGCEGFWCGDIFICGIPCRETGC